MNSQVINGGFLPPLLQLLADVHEDAQAARKEAAWVFANISSGAGRTFHATTPPTRDGRRKYE